MNTTGSGASHTINIVLRDFAALDYVLAVTDKQTRKVTYLFNYAGPSYLLVQNTDKDKEAVLAFTHQLYERRFYSITLYGLSTVISSTIRAALNLLNNDPVTDSYNSLKSAIGSLTTIGLMYNGIVYCSDDLTNPYKPTEGYHEIIEKDKIEYKTR